MSIPLKREEPIDLDAVSEELKNIESEIKDTDEEIGKYCEELGIKKPFHC